MGRDNFISCSLFFRSGSGQKTFVCLPSEADFHARGHFASIASFSSFLIALFAKRPWPITEVEHPPALASLSAASLPMMPSWALTHYRLTLFNWPSLLRLSLVSLQDFLVISVKFRVLSAGWLSTWKTTRLSSILLFRSMSAAALMANISDWNTVAFFVFPLNEQKCARSLSI
jgi:hypothetical protein